MCSSLNQIPCKWDNHSNPTAWNSFVEAGVGGKEGLGKAASSGSQRFKGMMQRSEEVLEAKANPQAEETPRLSRPLSRH